MAVFGCGCTIYGEGLLVTPLKTDDYGLFKIDASRVSPPLIKKILVDIPGGNGVIDLSDFLTDNPVYEERTFTDDFIYKGDFSKFKTVLSDLYNKLDGRTMHIRDSDDPLYYYLGRPQIANVEYYKSYIRITIAADVSPFKISQYSTVDDILWDDVNFETTIFEDFRNLDVDGELTISYTAGAMPAIPSITLVSGSLTATANGTTKTLTVGQTLTADEFVSSQGINTIRFNGTGVVTVNYRRGEM